MDNKYRIRLVRGDTEIEAEGDKDFVLQMLERFESFLADTSKLRQDNGQLGFESVVEAGESGKQISVGEFIRKVGFKKHVDIALAFGYYLEKYQGVPSFTPSDINSCYYDAKLDKSNTGQMIVYNIRRGYLMEAKKEKDAAKARYTLTGSGQDYIEAKLNRPSE